MQNPRLAARYAKSLLDIAVEQNQLEPTLADMKFVESVNRKSREFANMLRSPIISADKKESIINAVFGENLASLSKAFISLLVRKGREKNLPEIATAFVDQYKAMKGIKTVKLSSAAPLNDTVKEAIRKNIVASLPKNTIEIKEVIKPELIGGFVLEMDDKLFDASVRRDLNDVKAQFLKNLYIQDIR